MSGSFSPIAVVGQGCVLPGAFSPQKLWENVAGKRDLITSVPDGRWKLEPEEVLATGGDRADYTTSTAGSYVQGFESVFDPGGLGISAAEIADFDPMVAWLCHAGRDALQSAGLGAPMSDPDGRVGLILGNLSFPTESMAAWGEASYHARLGLNSDGFWSGLDADRMQAQRDKLREALAAPASINRFMSGLPAQVAARALGLRGSAFCLDAACASSLYAIALATDWLHQKRADVMLAGAVNRADSLFLHMGFSALQALSPSGRSRPFHAQADGLVPGEGAGIVALMRLDDAIAQKRPIAGVIRGIGLSNDGRAKNLLAPSSAGQIRAMRAAYAQAAWAPESISLVECHATGTPTGDGAELESMKRLFTEAGPGEIAIGSLKSNLGHLITTAGVAGLQKVLGAMAHKSLPPTLHVDEPQHRLQEAGSAFRPQNELADWTGRDGQKRRAAVSAFGFGGNNAHLLVEEWQPQNAVSAAVPAAPSDSSADSDRSQMHLPGLDGQLHASAVQGREPEIAVVAIGARSGEGASRADFYEQVFGEQRTPTLAKNVRIHVDGLRFPPNDLKEALPQQAMLFEAAREAVESLVEQPDPERFAVLMGMQCDVDVTTPGIRWRMPQRGAALSRVNGDSAPQKAWRRWGEAQKDQVAPPLTAAGVLGQMPNIPANRLNFHLDCQGPGFTISAEELSGVASLEVACSWLKSRAIDCALVGAVDICGDARHQEAMADVLGAACPRAADAAIVLVLKRLSDARDAGETVLATVGPVEHRMAPLRSLPADADVLWIDASASLPVSSRKKDNAALHERRDGQAEIAAANWRVADQIGHAHAATGLVGIAAAALACHTQTYPAKSTAKASAGEHGPARAIVATDSFGGASSQVEIRQADAGPHERAPKVGRQRFSQKARGVIEIPAHRAFQPIDAPTFSRPPSSNHLPSSVADMQAPNPKPQIMEPAPALPSVSVSLSLQATEPSLPPASQPGPLSAPTLATPNAVSTASAAVAEPAQALLEARLEMTRAHQAFLESQGAAQQAFLALQQRNIARFEEINGASTDGSQGQLPTQIPPAPSVQAIFPTSPDSTTDAYAPVAPATTTSIQPREKPAVSAPQASPSAPYVSPPPLWNRAELEALAAGKISEVFGELFEKQDGFSRQVRMPTPPLLLCDRVMSIDAEPGVLRPHTTIRTETDVDSNAWYIHEGRMPPGVLIESGQADLLLISYMGVDFENRGERVYRLLGCDLTYHSELPEAGTLLHFDIHIDGFATHGETRIFFFHSDCRKGGPEGELVLSVRNGQAGFFTDAELADSGGILWSPEDETPDFSASRLDAPGAICTKRSFARADLEAWAQGDAFACFGDGFSLAQTHVATPRPPAGDMLLFDRVTELDPAGGPWKRGYLRAELDLVPESWFFQGHFKDDPCMPGTMMFEGCLETLQLYLTAQGHTLRKDGWRFEPLHSEQFALRCRGQATPSAKLLVYEVFVKEVVGGEKPRIVADILATVDGLKALHCKDVGVQLVPDWPLTRHPELLGESQKENGWDAVGGVGRDDVAQNVVFDQRSLLATAWGKPSEAFGDMYAPFDDGRRVPRLPGPPYHFMSRVTHMEGPPQGEMKAGGTVHVDYDVPADAWYFSQGPAAVMPFAVLLEVALQPCGWLSSYVGSALTSAEDLCYRNLDGTGKVFGHVTPDMGTLTTKTTLTKVSQSAGMIIQEFALQVHAGKKLIFDATTAFGFFPPAALERQVGLAPNEDERAYFLQPGHVQPEGPSLPLDLAAEPAPYFGKSLSLPAPMLRMIDRVTGYLPQGGKNRAGWVRAEKSVEMSEWFFQAHFFTDPVQPGSLGLEAMVQTLQWWMLQNDLGKDVADGVFEPIARDQELVWRYRGQVVPTNGKIEVELHIGRVEEQDEEGLPRVEAEAWLWVDGLRIYRADLGLRIVPRDRLG